MSQATSAFDGYSADEQQALEATVRRNCACEFEANTGELLNRCAPCGMLVSDTRAMNGLLFMRRKKTGLLVGEFRKE